RGCFFASMRGIIKDPWQPNRRRCVITKKGGLAVGPVVSPASRHEHAVDSHAGLKPGVVFDQRYRIERPVGAGGVGPVYLAFDSRLGRPGALKIWHFDRGAAPELVKRFQREARIAAAFDHPTLCPIYDSNEAGSFHYLTMPFLEGEPLSARLEHGPLPP